jgi:hypothetical protein
MSDASAIRDVFRESTAEANDFNTRSISSPRAPEATVRARQHGLHLESSVEDWHKFFGNAAAVAAMLDRLLDHGHVLKCVPRSSPTKHQGACNKKDLQARLTGPGRFAYGRL